MNSTFVIARGEAPKQSRELHTVALDCFATLAMTIDWRVAD
jgi:hypothetical protein